MKILIGITIVLTTGLLGYSYKLKLNKSFEFLKFIQGFENYYAANVNLFRNDIQEIINNYIIKHKNKNAEFCNIFQKNGNIYQINKELLNKYVIENDVDIIYNYLSTIGTNDYDYEKEKNNNFKQYIDIAVSKADEVLKQKGNLYFKLSLAFGAILAIVIWW